LRRKPRQRSPLVVNKVKSEQILGPRVSNRREE
jgi:hypothetical protein